MIYFASFRPKKVVLAHQKHQVRAQWTKIIQVGARLPTASSVLVLKQALSMRNHAAVLIVTAVTEGIFSNLDLICQL